MDDGKLLPCLVGCFGSPLCCVIVVVDLFMLGCLVYTWQYGTMDC